MPLKGNMFILCIQIHKYLSKTLLYRFGWDLFAREWRILFFLKKYYCIYLICMSILPACVSVHHICAVFTEARRGHWVSRNCYRWLWATTTQVLGMKSGSSAEAAREMSGPEDAAKLLWWWQCVNVNWVSFFQFSLISFPHPSNNSSIYSPTSHSLLVPEILAQFKTSLSSLI